MAPTKTISSLMSELRSDHRNMVVLLGLLEAEAERLSGGSEPDYDLLESVMAYVADYPDAVHHPREDQLYRHLKSLHPDIDKSLERVETDHKELEHDGARLRDAIEDLAAGHSRDRDALVEGLRDYSQHLRTHMYWEEQQLFSLADQLGDERIEATRELAGESNDPLFGKQVEKKFRRLLNRIQRRMVWDSQQYL